MWKTFPPSVSVMALIRKSYSQIFVTRHITSSSYRNHACNEWKHLNSIKIKQFMMRTMQFQKRFLKRVAIEQYQCIWQRERPKAKTAITLCSLIIMTKNCFSKLMISYMYIFSQQLYSHACIPAADGPIITLFVVGVFLGGWGFIRLNNTLLKPKFSAYCFFLPIACFLVPFHSDHCILCEPFFELRLRINPFGITKLLLSPVSSACLSIYKYIQAKI